jgi:hypothetical protein
VGPLTAIIELSENPRKHPSSTAERPFKVPFRIMGELLGFSEGWFWNKIGASIGCFSGVLGVFCGVPKGDLGQTPFTTL